MGMERLDGISGNSDRQHDTQFQLDPRRSLEPSATALDFV
jgi:hypothetical protein